LKGLWKCGKITLGDIIDCYIAARMEKTGEKEIISYDKKINKLWLKIIEP
jgi:predicted nucleic-acid-binding protein